MRSSAFKAYRIRRVDHTDEEIEEILRSLHSLTFDPWPYPVSAEGEWWGDWWLAYVEREPVAFCGICQSDQGSAIGYLCRVGVLKEHRGNNLQKRMMRVAESRARKLGWKAIVSDTTKNPPSANNFIACGYKTYLPKTPWSFDAAIYWRKEL